MSRLRRGILTALGPVVANLLGCSSGEPTEIVAGVSTQMQVPRELQFVGVAVQSGGRLVHCLYYPVFDGTVSLPSTLGMQPSGDPSVPVTITVLGFPQSPPDASYDCLMGLPDMGEDNVTVLRRRRLPYSENRTVFLPMALKHACANIAPPCSKEETCIGGECQPLDVDPAALFDYQDAIAYGTTSTCFSVTQCLPDWATFPAFVVDRAACVFELVLPEGSGLGPAQGLNVALLHDDLTPEVLDLDPVEGYTIPDPSLPLRFQLAPSLCHSRFATGKIAAVLGSPLCLSKTPAQPICDADLHDILDGLSGLGGSPACEAGERLSPTASALYVVMDQSQAMGSSFGEQGLEQVLSLSLKDPAFESTQLAFKFAPAPESECGAASNSYATLNPATDVPFTNAALAQPAVAQLVGDLGNVLPGNDSVYWDVVMSAGGAYAALADLSPPPPSTSFNQRGLLLIGNRDFQSRCTPPSSFLPDLASTALASDGLRTYVVVTAVDPSVIPPGEDPVADAQAITSSGGTGPPFDATTDPNAGATAMLTLASQLGACLYDAPGGTMPADPQISYFDPLMRDRVDIPRNLACVDDTSFAEGWNTDAQGRVRICGLYCDSLRQTLMALSGSAAAAGLSAPSIPLRFTAPCPQSAP